MLEIQKYLATGKTYEDLVNEFGIEVLKHPDPTNPLVILNYNQIESPKTHPIVREARALTLNSKDHSLVARSFPRFFNWGEVLDEAKNFNFRNFHTQSKEDGSLILLYNYRKEWYANTRGSFGLSQMFNTPGEKVPNLTWRDCVCQALGINSLQELNSKLDPRYTYVGELVSPYNRIVRPYQTPQLYLLTAFLKENELSLEECDNLYQAAKVNFLRPTIFQFSSIEEILSFLIKNSQTDPTFEGVIIRDDRNNRWKVKSDTYLALHRLSGNGQNLFNPKHQIPLILAGEEAEILSYFDHATESFLATKQRIEEEYQKLEKLWQTTWQIPGSKANQKEFALAIRERTSFTSLLFTLRIARINREQTEKRKLNYEETEVMLRELWQKSSELIFKTLYK